MIKSSLCDYSAYMHCKGTITISNTAAAGAALNNVNKKVIFKNCAPFTDCTSEINNTEVDDARNITLVMPVYDLIEYSGIYSKTSGNLWHYYRDEPALNNAADIIGFPANNINSISFKFNQK